MAFAVSESLRSAKRARRRATPSPINWERLAALALNFAAWSAIIAGASTLISPRG